MNAPEFVPSDIPLPARPTDVADSAAAQASVDAAPPGAYSQKSSGLNVYCKPFDNRDRKHDPERVSSSNNSDSGISSPGSEDTSKGDFRGGEAKNERGEDAKKKPRAKRANKAKSKDEEQKSRELGQGGKKQNGKVRINDLKKGKKESHSERKFAAKNEFKSGRQFQNKYETVIAAINNLPVREEATRVESRKKEPRRSKKTADELVGAKSSLAERELEVCTRKIGSLDVNRHEVKTAVEENNNEVVEGGESESGTCDRCEGCEFRCGGDIEDDSCNRRTQPTVAESQPPALKLSQNDAEPVPDMLNEYVRIEEKPMLAKLVELGELTASPESAVQLEEMSISEFSSCRESAQPTVPPRRKKPNRRMAEEAAQQLVKEIIDGAEERILSSMACDTKLQLPITQAVTKWLNEHGGLQAVVEDPLHDSQNSDDDEEEGLSGGSGPSSIAPIKLKKSKQNCVIC